MHRALRQAPAAAHAHVALAEAGLVVVELVEHLVAHPLAGSGAELPLAGHLVEAGDLAGGGDAAALAHLGVVAVDDVAGGEAGAGVVRSEPDGKEREEAEEAGERAIGECGGGA